MKGLIQSLVTARDDLTKVNEEVLNAELTFNKAYEELQKIRGQQYMKQVRLRVVIDMIISEENP